jgi:hypothetical protein
MTVGNVDILLTMKSVFFIEKLATWANITP